jgi:hypothetical protein
VGLAALAVWTIGRPAGMQAAAVALAGVAVSGVILLFRRAGVER